MVLQAKTFSIIKGGTLEPVAQFLFQEIGLNAYLIKDIKGVSLSQTVTQITVLFEKYSPVILDSIAPREGAVFTTGVASNDFDIRFLFNDPVDFRSVISGSFSIDGVGLDTDKVYLDPQSNNYFLKVSASGSSFQSDAFHTYQLATSLKRLDGSTTSYTPVGGYVFHTLSNAHIGDYADPYIDRRRGKIAVAVVKLSKGINPQQGITEFLSQRRLSDDSLISYTPVSTNVNSVDVYFLYIDKLEPQIVGSFPLDNSLLPEISAPGKVTFAFNTPLDKSKLLSTTGLFSIEEGFSTSTEIPPSKITLLDDLQTVEIDTSTYFTSQKVYSILARPGILALNGLAKEKPELWTIHIASYEGGGTGVGATGVSEVDFNNLVELFTGHTGDPTIHYTQAEIDIGTGQINDLPELVPVPSFTGLSGAHNAHSGDLSIHFTTGEIEIVPSQINSESATAGFALTADGTGGASFTEIPGSEVTFSQFSDLSGSYTGHTGSTSIHFTQEDISITASQIDAEASVLGYVLTSDGFGNASWTEVTVSGGDGGATQAQYNYLSGKHFALSGDYTGHTGNDTIHFTVDSISHTGITDIGTNTHGQIDDHISNTGNPHSVTASQIGATPISYFTGLSGSYDDHTGDLSLHYTQASISLTSSQIDSEATASGYVLSADGGGGASWIALLEAEVSQAEYDYLSGQVESLSGATTGHINDSSIHFAKNEISHTGITDVGINTHYAIDSHIGDASIHYSVASIVISESQITDLKSYSEVSVVEELSGQTETLAASTASLSGLFDSHTGDTSIHFTEGSISHTNIQDIGSNTHAQIDTHITETTGNIGVLTSDLSDLSGDFATHLSSFDPHPNYLLDDGSRYLTGRLGSTQAAIASTDYIRKNESEADDLSTLSYVNFFIATFNSHTGDSSIHYTEASIDHTAISNIGTNSHSDIDNHISSTGNPHSVTASQAGALATGNSLSDVASTEDARRNLKCRYLIDDILTFDLLSSSDIHGVGSAYLYSLNAMNFVTGNAGTLGVMTTSCGNESTIGASAALRIMGSASLDLYCTDVYYFRTAISHNTSALLRFGLSQTVFASETDVVNGAYFEFDSSVGSNWYACTAASSSRTKTDTSVAATADTWKWWGIQAVSSGVYFYDMDTTDVVAFITTNIPAQADSEMRVFINGVCNGATWRHMWIDKFAYPIYAEHLPLGLASQF